MNPTATGSVVVILLMATMLGSGDPLTRISAEASSPHNPQTFDETRGVILEGDEGRELAEECGGTAESKARLSSADIKHLESDIKNLDRELAPLLTEDLRSAGSSATPRQYYRQYAVGKLDKWDAIFVNGFHESYFNGPFSADEYASWRHQLVSVSDGGTGYWCAIYVKGMKRHFVRFKKEGGGDVSTHVSFHGVA